MGKSSMKPELGVDKIVAKLKKGGSGKKIGRVGRMGTMKRKGRGEDTIGTLGIKLG